MMLILYSAGMFLQLRTHIHKQLMILNNSFKFNWSRIGIVSIE